jgi:hypothetical protein
MCLELAISFHFHVSEENTQLKILICFDKLNKISFADRIMKFNKTDIRV